MTVITAQGSRSLRLFHLANTVANSATFQRLCGVNSAAAALANVHVDLALDDGSAPFPRAIIRHNGSLTEKREGTTTFLGEGELAIFVQFVLPTDDNIRTFWTVSGTLTADDYRMHMNNLFGLMTDDFRGLATTAGCLEFQRIDEHSGGELDETTENGQKLWEFTWCVHSFGVP